MMKLSRFAIYAWGVLTYNVMVILWGTYVRATGSGAGCGNHWPLCNGQPIPRAPRVETIIEFTHRASSGLALLVVIGLLVWAFRAYPRGHLVRRGAGLSIFLIVTEALVGAGLVLLELVAENTSTARGFSTSIHLLNTFLLLAALTLTAWWASGGRPIRRRGYGNVGWALAPGLLGVMLLGVSGAVTALGDTLFPVNSLAEGIGRDFSPTAHLFIRLRLLHPLIAVVVALYWIVTAAFINTARYSLSARRLAQALAVLFMIQLGAGTLNLVLLAPVWLQVVHLLLADLVWITLVLLCASILAKPKVETEPAAAKAVKPTPQVGSL